MSTVLLVGSSHHLGWCPVARRPARSTPRAATRPDRARPARRPRRRHDLHAGRLRRPGDHDDGDAEVAAPRRAWPPWRCRRRSWRRGCRCACSVNSAPLAAGGERAAVADLERVRQRPVAPARSNARGTTVCGHGRKASTCWRPVARNTRRAPDRHERPAPRRPSSATSTQRSPAPGRPRRPQQPDVRDAGTARPRRRRGTASRRRTGGWRRRRRRPARPAGRRPGRRSPRSRRRAPRRASPPVPPSRRRGS